MREEKKNEKKKFYKTSQIYQFKKSMELHAHAPYRLHFTRYFYVGIHRWILL